MDTDGEHLVGLNNEQKEAALHTEGPLLVVAGAGAGKTKTITHRIVNLIKQGVPPDKILAVTFTNKAAKEMRDRISYQLLATSYQLPFVSTFHSLGVYIIKENARALGISRYFTILDEGDTTALIKNILKEIGLDPKQYDPRKIKNIISREKGKFTQMEDYAERENSGANSLGKAAAQVWNLYEKQKIKENSLDFDDLLLKAAKLLKENEEIRKLYQEKWEYVHIDEYQDTNEAQYLMSKLLSENNGNICVVGDPDQCIYSWRQADMRNILNFEKDYPNAKIILLEQNYRSTKNILEAANEVIKKNKYRPDKNLFTKNLEGEKIGLYEALDENDEADFVAAKILEILDSPLEEYPDLSSRREVDEFPPSFTRRGGRGEVFPPRPDGRRDTPASAGRPQEGNENALSKIAILYRANFQSRALEEAMLRHNIPYQVLGVKFFERREIKDTLAYLRAALNPDSLSDIKRIINFPARGIGKATLAKIFAGQRETLPIKMQIKINNFYQTLEEIKEKISAQGATPKDGQGHASGGKTSEIIKFVVKKSGIEHELSGGGEDDLERLENIKELATLALKYDNLEGERGVEKLLEDAALASDQDSLIIDQEKNSQGENSQGESLRNSLKKELNAVNPVRGREGSQRASTSNGVKLMTVHAAKGLEFKYVFVIGLEDGLFPHERQNERQTAEDQEEERRLFYVALTRAEKKLFLSFANFRTIFGSRQINAPSEFISDIPADLLEKNGEASGIKTIYL